MRFPIMGRQDRTDFYRSNRDYSILLNDGDEEEYEEEEEDYGSRNGGKMQTQQEDPLSQEYFERRQKLKELERQKLRRKLAPESRTNGRSTGHDRLSTEKNRRLPYDNYGSFFGPSEPVVARRIIEETRAREETGSNAVKISRESPEHKSIKGSSRTASESGAAEIVKEDSRANQAALKLQRLKESRDYSFLFTNEDPSMSPQQDVQPPDKDKRKEANRNAGKGGLTAKKGLTPIKISPTSKNATKLSTSTGHKVSNVPQRMPHSTDKLSKPAGKPSVPKPKLSSDIRLQSTKVLSGPGRPSQVGSSISAAGLANGKKIAAPLTAQPKKVAITGSTSNGVQHMKSGQSTAPRPGSSNTTGKGSSATPLQKSLLGERKTSVIRPEIKQPVVTGRPGPKQLASAGHVDKRRPIQSGGPSKQVMKPPLKPADVRKAPKRPRESDSEDPFLDDDDDDDDDGGGDVRSMIYKMLGYNPNKYRDLDDEDDRNMEADFRTIQMEERRSARIAREEDDRELALIEEEEEAERARKEAKQRKLKQR